MSEQRENALRLQELDLRNRPAIKIDLRDIQDKYDCLDLSSNRLTELLDLPYLPRLKVLLLNDTRLSKITPKLWTQIPNLESLSLANNHIDSLETMEFIVGLAKLQHLVLFGNPIAKNNYVQMLSKMQPSLRYIDFHKVKRSSITEGSRAAQLSVDETKRQLLLDRLEKAQSMEEIDAIEFELASLNK